MPILTIALVNCSLNAGNNYKISSKNILGMSQLCHWNDAMCLVHMFDGFRYLTCGIHAVHLDNNNLSYCQVFDNTTSLTCSFLLARFPAANIAWNITSNNINLLMSHPTSVFVNVE